ncbi:MAG: hypothetical protein ACYC3B_01320 [Sedimentisphaerales bacterium]
MTDAQYGKLFKQIAPLRPASFLRRTSVEMTDPAIRDGRANHEK